MHYIIGCGGVGSAIVPSFCLLKSPAEITLIDGDIWDYLIAFLALVGAVQVYHVCRNRIGRGP